MESAVKANHWVCDRDNSFAEWHIVFPEEQMTSPWEVFQFMRQLYEIGEEEAVYRVLRTAEPNAYRAISNISYIQHLEKVLRETGEFIGFINCDGAARRDNDNEGFLATARLCYYDETGEIIESEVGDVGKLLMQIRPDMHSDARNHMSSFFPVSLYGQKGGWSEDGTPYQTSLIIYTRTNIWFPRVRGFPSEPRKWYDNTELALRHTPRLNQFLRRVKELTLEYGGKWELSDDQKDEIHWPMLSEDGIILDEDILARLPE